MGILWSTLDYNNGQTVHGYDGVWGFSWECNYLQNYCNGVRLEALKKLLSME